MLRFSTRAIRITREELDRLLSGRGLDETLQLPESRRFQLKIRSVDRAKHALS